MPTVYRKFLVNFNEHTLFVVNLLPESYGLLGRINLFQISRPPAHFPINVFPVKPPAAQKRPPTTKFSFVLAAGGHAETETRGCNSRMLYTCTPTCQAPASRHVRHNLPVRFASPPSVPAASSSRRRPLHGQANRATPRAGPAYLPKSPKGDRGRCWHPGQSPRASGDSPGQLCAGPAASGVTLCGHGASRESSSWFASHSTIESASRGETTATN